MNGLLFMSLTQFRSVGTELVEDNSKIPDRSILGCKVPYLASVDITISGPLEPVMERSSSHVREVICRGMCKDCSSIVFVKNVTVWNQQQVISAGCTCGCVEIVPCNEEAGYMEVRNKCFGRLKHKRNREPADKLPIPWVKYQVVDTPVSLQSKDLYVDTEGTPCSLWQIFDPIAGLVYITNYRDTFDAMVKGKTIYTWGAEPGIKTINVQVRSDGLLLSLKDAMELIGYTLDKRYTLSDWGKKISDVTTPGEERYQQEAYAYAARDALAVYLWRMCSAYVPISKPQYILDTEYSM